MDLEKVILSFLLKILPFLVTAIGGAIGGPLGWIVSFLLSSLSSMAAKMAERALKYGAIEEKIKLQVDALNGSAQAFFEIEDRREKGETISQEERDAAKAKFKADAKKLIDFRDNVSNS